MRYLVAGLAVFLVLILLVLWKMLNDEERKRIKYEDDKKERERNRKLGRP